MMSSAKNSQELRDRNRPKLIWNLISHCLNDPRWQRSQPVAARCRQVEALVIQALKQKEAAAANDITSIAPSADAAQEKA